MPHSRNSVTSMNDMGLALITSRSSAPCLEGMEAGGGGAGSGAVSGGGIGGSTGSGNGGNLYLVPYETPVDASDWPKCSSTDNTPRSSRFRKKPTRSSLERAPYQLPAVNQSNPSPTTDKFVLPTTLETSEKLHISHKVSFDGRGGESKNDDIEAPMVAR